MKNNDKHILEEMGLRKIDVKSNNSYVTIIITGDFNNGDYITEETKFSLANKEEIEHLRYIVNCLKIKKEQIYNSQAITNILNNEIIGDILNIPFCFDRYCDKIVSIKFEYTNKEGETAKLEIF